MSDLYPDPPHLSIAVYCEKSQVDTFAEVCGVVESQLGGSATGMVRVAPRDTPFEWVSDLADVSHETRTGREESRLLIEGKKKDHRVVKAGYRNKKLGPIVVEYFAAHRNERHPIGITVSADALGIPEFAQTRREQTRAKKLARWSLEALEGISGCEQVLYGCIGVELPRVSPASLRGGHRALPTEVFVAQRVIDSTPGLGQGIRHIYPEKFIRQSERGVHLCGWAPFTPDGTSLPDPADTGLTLSRLLAKALRSRSGG